MFIKRPELSQLEVHLYKPEITLITGARQVRSYGTSILIMLVCVNNYFYHACFITLYNRLKNTAMNIHFWRTKDMVEVDFVITGGSKTIPFEVQYSHLKKAKISRCFQNFSSKYQPEKGYLVNLSYRDTSKT